MPSLSVTLIDALESYATGNGYSHVLGGEENYMATEQAALALTAYELSKNGSSLYDMSANNEPVTPDEPVNPGDSSGKPDEPILPGDSSGKPDDKNNPVSPDTGVLVTGGMAVLISGAVMLVSKKKRK